MISHSFIYRALLAGAALCFSMVAQAHKPSDSYMTIAAQSGQAALEVRWDIALRDLDFALSLDRNDDAQLTWGEVQQSEQVITRYAIEHFSVTNAADCPLTVSRPLQIDRHSDGGYVVLWLRANCAQPARQWQASYRLFFDLDPTHRGLMQWVVDGAPITTGIFRPSAAELKLTLGGSAWQDVGVQYALDGVWHIWIGVDHILFLMALLLPSVMLRAEGRWVGVDTLRGAMLDIFKVVTAFTLAHSMTLSLAALQVVQLPSRLVEAAIAFSVLVAALNNVRGLVHHRRWMMAFGFGLLHGFGFAAVLVDLGLPTGLLALALASFNVGVELGQLALVVVLMPLAFWLRYSRFYRIGVLQVGSILVALIAAVWTIERALGEKWLPF